MPQGLQIWDAQGQLQLDVTTRLTKVHGEIETGTTSGSFQIPYSPGTPFIVIDDNSQVYRRQTPGIWLDGRVIKWEFSSSIWAPTPFLSCKIKYGYY